MLFQQKSHQPKPSSSRNPSSGTRSRMIRVFRRKSQRQPEKEFATIGGVFAKDGEKYLTKQASSRSVSTIDTRKSDESTSSHSSWNSSGLPGHHKGAPLVAEKYPSLTRINPESRLSEEEMLGRIILKSKKLPTSNGYLVSNHVMINNERVKRFVPPLRRMPEMDLLAREHAKLMATRNELFHSDAEELHKEMGRQSERRIGENVASGNSVPDIQKKMMSCLADRNNVIDRRFIHMGVGTAKSSDGTIYLCQLFRD